MRISFLAMYRHKKDSLMLVVSWQFPLADKQATFLIEGSSFSYVHESKALYVIPQLLNLQLSRNPPAWALGILKCARGCAEVIINWISAHFCVLSDFVSS